MYCLPCGHAFCRGCWHDAVKTVVDSGEFRVRCLEAGCSCKLPPSSIRDLCGEQIYSDFLHFLMDQQVNLADTFDNCPNPPCSKPLNRLSTTFCGVLRCPHCAHESCSQCHEMSHAPATCQEKQRWAVVTGDDLMA